MLKSRKRTIALAIILCMILLSFNTTGYAADMKKAVTAVYKNIKVVANGSEVAMDLEPFIVDGRTYVPVRAIANIFDKNVEWDAVNSKVIITNKPDTVLTYLYSRIAEKDTAITALQNQVKSLEAQLDKALKNKGTSLSDLEDDLNDDYSEYKNIEFDIQLNGDEDDIEVQIHVDLDDFEDEWDDLTTSNLKSYLQNIIDDILDAFEDADIEGYIKDDYSRKILMEFYADTRGYVVLDSSSSDVDIDDLEDALHDDYYNYFSGIRVSIELSGDEDDITFTVNVRYDTYEDEWDDLTRSQIQTFMDNIYDDIESEFEDADIEGIVYDEDNDETLGTYTYSGGYRPY